MLGCWIEVRMPAAPASAEPRPKVKEMTTSVLMPMSDAATGLNDKRAHRHAHLRVQHDGVRPKSSSKRDAEDEHLAGGDRQRRERAPGLGNLDRAVGDDLGKRLRVGAEDELAGVFEEERNADGGDEHGELRTVAQRPVAELFDDDADERADAAWRASSTAVAPAQRGPAAEQLRAVFGADIKSRERAEHEDVAVREIDEAQDAIDHRVAQRDERVDRALRQPVDELLEKFDHGAARA